jgi:hypothetical protein
VDSVKTNAQLVNEVYSHFKYYKAVKMATLVDALRGVKNPLERTSAAKRVYSRIQKGE